MALLRRNRDTGQRVLRKDRVGMSPVRAGALLIGAAVVLTYFGFTKHIPFTHGYRLNAVFQNAVNIKSDSPVRIAGVNVGKVTGIDRAGGGDASVVKMELDDKALPIHKDATMKIRPRIFLEGNFFVDLSPGTPSAPKLSADDTIPVTQTASPVQLDQVLTALQSNSRADLQDLLVNYGESLKHQPTAAEDATQDPAVQGKTAAQALNGSLRYSGGALRNVSIVNQALLGLQARDLSKLIASFGKVAGALDSNEAALQGLITNFNITTGAFAAQSSNLSATIRLLAPTLRNANRTFASLNRAFPPTRAFAREILPGVRATPGTIAASFPWIAQTRALLGPKELRGLARELQPTTARLARLTDDTIRLLPQVDLIDRCLTNVVLPTGDVKINDGTLTSGVENYKEFWYTMVSLAGEGQNFDGNGMYVRFQPGGGSNTVSTGKTTTGGDQLFGNAVAKPIGTRPHFPGHRSPYKPAVPCYTQQIPDLNGPAANVGAVESSVRTQSRPTALATTANRSGTPSLADQLVARLNPFRKAAGK
ncbi:MAG: MlaD family protein [Actinomycetota bacterium]|nr:MlaD family protein [Actinomycetota bacterium]